MLREHYCGSLTFREQRNTIENLCQKPNEAAINFLIRVGTSVSNLAKNWKDELTEGELQALEYEVSLNGVKEEIRHVLDSEMAKRDGHLTPQQMYEAVKRYEGQETFRFAFCNDFLLEVIYFSEVDTQSLFGGFPRLRFLWYHDNGTGPGRHTLSYYTCSLEGFYFLLHPPVVLLLLAN